jgi:hypothetical protein
MPRKKLRLKFEGPDEPDTRPAAKQLRLPPASRKARNRALVMEE